MSWSLRAAAANQSQVDQGGLVDPGLSSQDKLLPTLDLAMEIVNRNPDQLEQMFELYPQKLAQSQADLKQKIPNYADTYLRLEQERQKAKEQAEQFMSPLPNNVCKQRNLPGPVSNICDRFFNESAQIIRSNGLSLQDFNDITNKLRSDSNWKSLFDQEIRRRRY
ncbi:MAG: DUF4168 domain-containing protein [Acaryochloridaceae cyanobacterium CSU_5_19]|nr:DUF4168 domain-containing protein [Acaryochloridaceae cyanobacterium CSU_5_19]